MRKPARRKGKHACTYIMPFISLEVIKMNKENFKRVTIQFIYLQGRRKLDNKLHQQQERWFEGPLILVCDAVDDIGVVVRK